MESEIERIRTGSVTYSKYVTTKATKLDIDYCNKNYGTSVVPLETVIRMLKDIELRLISARDEMEYESNEYEMVDFIYQDI